MSRNIWIGLVVLIILVAAGWWYFNQYSSSVPQTTQQSGEPTTQVSTQAAVQNQQTEVQNSPATSQQSPTNSTANGSIKMTATPTSGTAPLTVNFSNFAAGCDQISFGDPPDPDAPGAATSYGSWPVGGVSHTYKADGTFTAELDCGADSPGRVTITVSGGNSTGPFATIDQTDLTQKSGTITLSGTATGIDAVQVAIEDPGMAGEGYGDATTTNVINGKWRATLYNVPSGSHTVVIWNAPQQPGTAPTTQLSRSSTLTVTQ